MLFKKRQELVEWITENENRLHPILVASIIHYNLVRVHAFDDGNGRGARILMNLFLMKHIFFPAVIRTERKRKYLSALQKADRGNIYPFIKFMASELIEIQKCNCSNSKSHCKIQAFLLLASILM